MDAKELEQYVDACDWSPREFVIEMGGRTIRFLLKPCDKPEVERAFKDAAERRWDDKAKQWTTVTNEKKFRHFIAETCITGWEGWTKGLVAELAGKKPMNGARQSEANEPVEYSVGAAEYLLGKIIGLDGEIFREVLKRADERAAEESGQKNG